MSNDEFENFPDMSGFPDMSDAQPMTFSEMRDMSLQLFDRMLASNAGIPPTTDYETLERQREMLTLEETEAIVREKCVVLENGLIAVKGDSPEDAQQKVRTIINALLHRIMSNVLSRGVSMGLLDAAFDDEANEFAFRVSEKGEKFCARLAQDPDAEIELDDDDSDTDD